MRGDRVRIAGVGEFSDEVVGDVVGGDDSEVSFDFDFDFVVGGWLLIGGDEFEWLRLSFGVDMRMSGYQFMVSALLTVNEGVGN